MKKVILKVIILFCAALFVFLLIVGIFRQNNATLYVDIKENQIIAVDSSVVKDMPVLQFAKTKHDFGTFRKKRATTATNVINVEFEFQNIGNVPLIIFKTDVSCDCLSADVKD